MPTNKIVLDTVDNFMEGYSPVYQPLYSLLLANSIAYSEEVGKVNFHQLDAVGDIRGKRITPKDTEIAEISVIESAKSFKKYFFANRYIQSKFQKPGDINGVIAQVLEEYEKHMDEVMLLGEGTAANNVVNDGLFWNAQTNYRLDSSEAIDSGTGAAPDFYATLMSELNTARDLPGKKAIVVYGSTALGLLDALYPSEAFSVRSVIEGALESDESIVRMPTTITPAGTNGFIIINTARTRLHYAALPKLHSQGVNDEKMYSWHNFLMGSSMVEVQSPNAVIRQPLTFS
jgi:hypothetical protein